MAGTRRGLARGASRRTHGPAQAGEAGDRGACGAGVTVGQQPWAPWEGVRAEGMLPSGQCSRDLPRGLRRLPTPSFPTHVPTRARAPTLVPRVSTSRTHSRTTTPGAAPRTSIVTGHEFTPLRPHPHRLVPYSDSPLRVPWPIRLNMGRAMAAAGAGETISTLPCYRIPFFLPTVVFVPYGTFPHSGGGGCGRSRKSCFLSQPPRVTKITKCLKLSNHLSPKDRVVLEPPRPPYIGARTPGSRLLGLLVVGVAETLILKGGPLPPPP